MALYCHRFVMVLHTQLRFTKKTFPKKISTVLQSLDEQQRMHSEGSHVRSWAWTSSSWNNQVWGLIIELQVHVYSAKDNCQLKVAKVEAADMMWCWLTDVWQGTELIKVSGPVFIGAWELWSLVISWVLLRSADVPVLNRVKVSGSPDMANSAKRMPQQHALEKNTRP